MAKASVSDLNQRQAASGRAADKTTRAVQRQLQAMGCERYEVGIRDPEKGMMIREWTPDEVLKAVPWLRRENAKGADIYVRPHQDEPSGLVLVDDVDEGVAEDMRHDGLAASVAVETSPKNWQCWVRVASEATAQERTEAARIIARRYEADENSADWRHFGRLAGFTNRKPEHTTGKGQPFALLKHARASEPQYQPAEAPALYAEAQQAATQARRTALQREHDEALQPHLDAMPTGGVTGALAALKMWWHEMWRSMRENLAERFDPSRADWIASVRAFRKGHSYEDVARVVETSPGIETRKPGHISDYVQRTAGKAEIYTEYEAQGCHYMQVRDVLLEEARQRAQERARARTNEPDALGERPQERKQDQGQGGWRPPGLG